MLRVQLVSPEDAMLSRLLPFLMLFGPSLALADSATNARPIFVITPQGKHTLSNAFVEDGELYVNHSDLAALCGFERREEGLCRDDLCLPSPSDGRWFRMRGEEEYINLSLVADHLGQAVVHSEALDAFSFSATSAERDEYVVGNRAPDFALTDRSGDQRRLSDFRGKKVLLLTWASW